jgi:hypothetical protein
MNTIAFTNGYQLHIDYVEWTCGDGCCSESYYRYELYDAINEKTIARGDEFRGTETELEEMIIEDYELCLIKY